MAREITKLYEEFWRGFLVEATQVFSAHQPKGELTLLIQGKANSEIEMLSEILLENELTHLISTGHSLSMAVKLVSQGTSTQRKTVYSVALQKFGKELQDKDG